MIPQRIKSIKNSDNTESEDIEVVNNNEYIENDEIHSLEIHDKLEDDLKQIDEPDPPSIQTIAEKFVDFMKTVKVCVLLTSSCTIKNKDDSIHESEALKR